MKKQQGGISCKCAIEQDVLFVQREVHGHAAELLITGILVGGATSAAAAGDAADEAKELVLEPSAKLRHGR